MKRHYWGKVISMLGSFDILCSILGDQDRMKNITILVLAVILTGCVTTSKQAVNDFHTTFVVGMVVSNEVSVGGNRVPLLPGEHLIISTHQITQNLKYRGGGPMPGTEGKFMKGDVVLAQIKDGILHTMTFIDASIQPLLGNSWWNKSWVCTEKNILHSVVSSDGLRNQDCWHVRHRAARSKAQAIQKAFRYFADHNISIPSHVIASSHAFTNKGKYLTVNYLFNPQIEGVSPSGAWNKARLHMFEEKQQYVDKVVSWSDKWHGKIKSTFMGNNSASSASSISGDPFGSVSGVKITVPSGVNNNVVTDSFANKLMESGQLYNKPYFVIRVEDHVYEGGDPKFTVSPGDILEIQTTKTCRSGHGLCARVINPDTGEWGFIIMSTMKKLHLYVD